MLNLLFPFRTKLIDYYLHLALNKAIFKLFQYIFISDKAMNIFNYMHLKKIKVL